MPRATLPLGRVLADRFELIQEAGRGGSSVVYRALDRSTRAPVAVKLLAARSPSPAAQQRFSREVKLLGELRHPGIVRYVTHGALPEGRAFLVMEWIEGEPLSRRLLRSRLSPAECVALLRRVGDALSAAHPRKIVHRDIKPSNIMLRDSAIDRAVLLDFGVARYGYDQRSVTRTGALIGTPFYMAPEQARADPNVGPASDVYSLGAVLYECLSGSRPFTGDHPTAVLSKILLEECAPLREKAPGAPAELCALVDRMMSKDPAERPGSAAALLDEMSALLGGLGQNDSDPSSTDAALSQAPLTDAETVLVSVIMAAPPSIDAEDNDNAPSGPVFNSPAALAELKAFGARAEQLADGSLLGTLTSQSSSAVDLVSVGAQCALAMRACLPGARAVLATGFGVRAGQRLAMGETLERAARLAQASADEAQGAPRSTHEGVVMDDVSAGLLSGRFSRRSDARGAIVVGERATFDEGRLLRGEPAPFVGRELEVSLVETLVRAAIDEREARALLITGPAGIGKSRFREEVLRSIRAAVPKLKTLLGRGELLTAGSPHGILKRALRHELRVDDGELAAEQRRPSTAAALRAAERLDELCAAGSAEGAHAARADSKIKYDEIHKEFVHWIRAECAAAPVVLVLEDLQWGDRPTIKLVDAVVRELSDMPLVVLAVARPEVSDVFPRPWHWLSEEVSLHPLNKKASAALVRSALGSDASTAAIERIVEHAGGNPLYLEELIRAEMAGRGGSTPETLLAMLHARFSRLAIGARRILRAASVFGEVFCCRGVLALERGRDDEIAGWMSLLIDEQIVRRSDDGSPKSEGEHRFCRAIYREAAYRMLTPRDRAAGHAAASHYLERAGEADPRVIAEHAERGGDRARALWFDSLARDSDARRAATEAARPGSPE